MRPSTARTVMGVRFCVLATTLAVAMTTGLLPQTGPGLQRHKRGFEWKEFQITEESLQIPQKLFQLSSNESTSFTKYAIEGDGVGQIFVVEHDGVLYAKEKLDREQKSVYNLQAKLIDVRTGQMLDSDTFRIKVLDINDNAPVFPPAYRASVTEQSHRGAKVLKVTATDADDPDTANGQVIYQLLNYTDVFQIDDNGIITTKVNNLDRERQSIYVVAVQAKDMPGHNTGGTATTAVTITVADINDNVASFKNDQLTFDVREDEKVNFKIGTMEVLDNDEEQNKNPDFSVEKYSQVFEVVRNQKKDGVLTLKQGLDYETKSQYSFKVSVSEDVLVTPDKPRDSLNSKVQVLINVLDVPEPPVFDKKEYNFSVREDVRLQTKVGTVSAKDKDITKNDVRYHIDQPNFLFGVDSNTGEIFTLKELDRERTEEHIFYVTAMEVSPDGLKSHVLVRLRVLDVNDNAPELYAHDIFVCENDPANTIIGTINATDQDEHAPKFSFSLAKPNYNFSLIDNKDNTASISVKQGGFNAEDTRAYVLEIMVTDGGAPPLSSTTALSIPVCSCDNARKDYYCKPDYTKAGVSFSALIAIILCILTILVIVILIVLRKRYQKEVLVTLGKPSGEIHEQLVTYDEEGGGEMDTNGYDVSILTSARNDGSMAPAPVMYAAIKRPPAAKGNMAVMIEVKKDEADHDRDGIPYDTLHIYGYEGPESLADSLSSLETSSDDSSLDYDFLSDWGPRFKTLAELYGADSTQNEYLN